MCSDEPTSTAPWWCACMHTCMPHVHALRIMCTKLAVLKHATCSRYRGQPTRYMTAVWRSAYLRVCVVWSCLRIMYQNMQRAAIVHGNTSPPFCVSAHLPARACSCVRVWGRVRVSKVLHTNVSNKAYTCVAGWRVLISSAPLTRTFSIRYL